MQVSKVLATLLMSALASTAFAHKAADNHTHCTVGGKGVRADGATDAERKTACGKIANSKWDETAAVPVGPANAASKAATPAPEKTTP